MIAVAVGLITISLIVLNPGIKLLEIASDYWHVRQIAKSARKPRRKKHGQGF